MTITIENRNAVRHAIEKAGSVFLGRKEHKSSRQSSRDHKLRDRILMLGAAIGTAVGATLLYESQNSPTNANASQPAWPDSPATLVSPINLADAIIDTNINSLQKHSIAEPQRSVASIEQQQIETNFRKHGKLTDHDFNQFVQSADTENMVIVTANKTIVMFPKLHQGGFGFGAFVVSDLGKHDVFYTSFHDDQFFQHDPKFGPTAIETVFATDQTFFNKTGRIAVAVSDGMHGGVMVFQSGNGGVDWTNTNKSFNFALDNPDQANAPHRDTMKGQFNSIVNGLK